MVIRKSSDVFDLLENRIDRLEDLNCEELLECIRAFMLLHTTITTMESARELATSQSENSEARKKCKKTFDTGNRLVGEMVRRIDELTMD